MGGKEINSAPLPTTAFSYANGSLSFRALVEQEAYKCLVGSVDLVDQKHGRSRARRIDRLQQRTPNQKPFRVQRMPRLIGIEILGRLEDAELEQLPGVIPLVERVTDLEALVALKTDQIAVEDTRNRCRERRLADAGFTFEEQGPPQPQRQEQ